MKYEKKAELRRQQLALMVRTEIESTTTVVRSDHPPEKPPRVPKSMVPRDTTITPYKEEALKNTVIYPNSTRYTLKNIQEIQYNDNKNV